MGARRRSASRTTWGSTSVAVLLVFQILFCSSGISSARRNPEFSSPLPAPVSPAQAGRIDTHTHYSPDFYKELLDSRDITSGGRPIPRWNATAHLELNARIGVSTSVVSVSVPGAKLSEDSPIEEGRGLARVLNEYGHNLTIQYPGSFLYFATLTLPDLEGAIVEAAYALDHLGAAGVIVQANAFGELFGSRRYDALYKVLNDRYTTVFIHPSESPCQGVEESEESLPPYVIDFLLDTTRAALNLVRQNVTRDYPNINFILAHSGGFLPFAATRAAGGLALLSGRPADQNAFLQTFRERYYVDLALSASPSALPSTTTFFDSTRITFGSDFPFSPSQGIDANVETYENFQFGVGGSQTLTAQSRINRENAYQLFKRFLE